MKKLTVFKGFHRSFTLPSIVKNYTINEKFQFINNSKYSLSYPDNLDWNKLTGFNLSLFEGFHFNSFRIGWRYNSLFDTFELIPYYYINGIRYKDETNIVTVNKDVIFTIKIYLDVKIRKVYYNINGTEFLYSLPINIELNSKNLSWKGRLYFGGNMVAPSKIQVLKLI